MEKKLNINIVRKIKMWISNKRWSIKKYIYEYIRRKNDKKNYEFPYLIYSGERISEIGKTIKGFKLVGRNWINKPSKQICLCYGFNDWKLGFVTRYLEDFRVIFCDRKISSVRLAINIFLFPQSIEKIIVWGITDTVMLRWIARLSKKEINRMEDGLIRSVELGSDHATPLSLIIDKKGIYYKTDKPSELNDLLASAENYLKPDILKEANYVINAIRFSGITKYNRFTATGKANPSYKERILVLGQVENDAALKFGNINKISQLQLVEIAVSENPNSHVVYRPHPQVYEEFSRNKNKMKKFQKLCEISDPNGSLSDDLSISDKVYTINSGSGLEAIIHGKETHLFGWAFYAGYGLSKDRYSKALKRLKPLNLLDFVAVVYIIYPQYLISKSKKEGARLTIDYILQTRVDHEGDRLKKLNKFDSIESINPSYLYLILGNVQPETEFSLIKKINFPVLLQKGDEFSAVCLALYLFSKIKDIKNKKILIINMFENLPLQIVVEFLNVLYAWQPECYEQLIGSFLPFIDDSNTCDYSDEILKSKLFVKTSKINPTIDEQERSKEDFKAELWMAATISIEKRQIERATNYVYGLLLCYPEMKSLDFAAQIAKLSFRNDGLRHISEIALSVDQSYRAGIFWNYYFNALVSSIDQLKNFEKNIFRLIKNQPSNIYHAIQYCLNTSSRYHLILFKILRANNFLDLGKVQAYIAIEQFSDAENLLDEYQHFYPDDFRAFILRSQLYSYTGRMHEALKIIKSVIFKHFNTAVVSEHLRLNVLLSDYLSSRDLFSRIEQEKIKIGDMHRRKYFFGMGELRNAFLTFREISPAKTLMKYFPDNFKRPEYMIADGNKKLILSIFGPGDEIRFASIYSKLVSHYGMFLNISCSPKLLPIMRRSFTEINFIPVSRPRGLDTPDLNDYKMLPGSDLVGILDNFGMEFIKQTSCEIALVTDFLGDYLHGYDNFMRESYLKFDSCRAKIYSDKLPKGNKLIGISWRSSLTSVARSEHYLSIKDLTPVFEVEGVQFVNLQYDDCEEELLYIESHFPGKIFNLKELNQFDDLDGVAALMSCLDLVISPATTVAELAGAIGVKTWLFSNSSELNWRSRDSSNSDAWHSSVEILRSKYAQTKHDLVLTIVERIKNHFSH